MSRPRLCVTVSAPTTAELRTRRDAVIGADLVELRLDLVRDPDVAGALAGRRVPVVVTCRPVWEGGRFDGSEEERRRILVDALALGAEYVDVEWRAPFAADVLTETGGTRLVLSTHDFERVPPDLRARAQAMQATGAEVVKVAGKANGLADCVPLLDLCGREDGPGRMVVLGLGDYGAVTRILAARFGSAWTYAGSIREIGQLSAESLLEAYRFRSLTDSTAIYGIVGGSVAHSVSPSMHNAAFGAAHIDAVYVPFPAVDATDFVTFARALGISGASVTIPHKVTLVDRLDEVDPTAKQIGAINTIRVENGRWIGRNTDITGFLAPLREREDSVGRPPSRSALRRDSLRLTSARQAEARSGRRRAKAGGPKDRGRAAVLGAGGAARAVTVALVSKGYGVTVYARNLERARQLAETAPVDIAPWPPAPGTWDLLVNCTPIGMYPHIEATPIPASQLTGRCVYDLVYNPSPTRLLREAAAAGCETIDGLAMLVAQAQEQFQWWTGMGASDEVMRAAAMKRLSEFTRDENYVV